MKIHLIVAFLLVLAGTMVGCNLSEETEHPVIEITGEITYLELEGGAWVIEGSEGITYEPLNLPDEFKQEGLSVHIIAEKQPNKASILQVGPIIEIRSIERR